MQFTDPTNKRKYYTNESNPEAPVIAFDPEDSSLPEILTPREKIAALGALIAGNAACQYVWGLQDAAPDAGHGDSHRAFLFGQAFAAHVFAYKMERNHFQRNVRDAYRNFAADVPIDADRVAG